MREILFRGKRKDNGEWVYGYYYESKISGCFILAPKIKVRKKDGVIIGDSFEVFKVLSETVGQFTGLTDKNGKKIFEGDIVEFTDKYTQQKGRAEIVFEAFKWKYSGCYYGGNPIVWLCIDDQSVEFEIIGNIYDNPELVD